MQEKKAKRYEVGLEQMRKQFGEDADKYLKPIEEISSFFNQINVEFPYGMIYTRDKQLDLKTRELVTIGALITLGHCEKELRLHIQGALRMGATQEEIIEVICQMIAYIGFPYATHALLIAKEIFDSLA